MRNNYDQRAKDLTDALGSRIVVLDGAMGTMVQRAGVEPTSVDELTVSRPDLIADIHRQYIAAGADIIETNTFGANALSLAAHDLSHEARAINLAAARLARSVADEAERSVWVAGSVGPTGTSLSIAQSMGEADAPTFDTLAEAYTEQMEALIDGGVDLLLMETMFDGLNARAAVYAAQEAMERAGRDVPVIISATLTEQGRTLSGQTLDAFIASVGHIDPLAISLNCGFGADGMTQYIEALQRQPYRICIYPNAGLPNAMGEYDETPQTMARKLEPLMERGWLNIVGGCCGTTPEHIRLIAETARRHKPRTVPKNDATQTILAGLDAFTIDSPTPLINVGERCNVAGSRKFLRLIKEGAYDEAIAIARNQIEAGASIIDLNLDDAMLDAPAQMRILLSRLGADPATARVPVMIDSSQWEAVGEALKCIQGRPIVNSISLKEGEDAFLAKARHIKRMGAAIVVMAFDEEGQATTYERKCEICSRAYRLLTEKAGIAPSDIIFDPAILTIATGIEEHRRYGVDFIEATRWIKQNLTGARVSGGLSNLSFAFRGNNALREAMHAVFLHHAVAAGMDMAIINPSSLISVDSIAPRLREAIEDAIFGRRTDAAERLTTIAAEMKAAIAPDAKTETAENTTTIPAGHRLAKAIEHGTTSDIERLIDEAVETLGSAMAVINGPLMEGMNRIGELFGRGELFLPQVVKSAAVMKRAVERLTPLIEAGMKAGGSASDAPTFVLATVKGDVHDIGKNIVAVILQCNGFRVVDLGVMVPAETIIDRAIKEGAAAIGLSGLITPSLAEMSNVAAEMERRGVEIPLFVGGAAASAEHTAVKIAPTRKGLTVYTHDAARLPVVARRLLDKRTAAEAAAEIRTEQEHLRKQHAENAPLLPLGEARRRRFVADSAQCAPAPLWPGEHNLTITVADARHWINARAFFAAWKLDASLAALTEIEGCDHCRAQWLAAVVPERRRKAAEAMQLWKKAQMMLKKMVAERLTLKARVTLAEARADHDSDTIIISHEGITLTVPTIRTLADESATTALSDFVSGEGDHIGVFAVTIGEAMRRFIDSHSADPFERLLVQSLTDRLVEAATEIVHHKVRKSLWGYAPLESDEPRRLLRADYQGIRPAIGYPSLPDQSVVFIADRVLRYGELGIRVTENGALQPSATTTGLMIGHRQARYFAGTRLTAEARADYIRRRGMSDADADIFLPR